MSRGLPSIRVIRGLPVIPAAIAVARVIEARVRRSKRATRLGRAAAAALGKVSPEVRAFIRLRIMKLV